MPLSYNDSGTWRGIVKLQYNDNSTWRTIVAAWYNDNGTWRKVFGFTIAATTPSVVATDYGIGSALAQLNLNSDGSMTNQGSTNLGSWGTPVSAGAGSGKYVKWRRNTGTLPSTSSGFTENTWVSMGSLRYLFHSTTGNQFKTCTVYIQFADDSGGGGASTEGLCEVTAQSEI